MTDDTVLATKLEYSNIDLLSKVNSIVHSKMQHVPIDSYIIKSLACNLYNIIMCPCPTHIMIYNIKILNCYYYIVPTYF